MRSFSIQRKRRAFDALFSLTRRWASALIWMATINAVKAKDMMTDAKMIMARVSAGTSKTGARGEGGREGGGREASLAWSKQST